MEGTLRTVEQVTDKLVEESGLTSELGRVQLYRLVLSISLHVSLSDFLTLLPRVPYCIPNDPLVQMYRERDGDIWRAPEEPVEMDVSKEKEDISELNRTLMDTINRLTAMKGGMKRVKTETLKRILHIRSKCGENTAKRGASSPETDGGKLVHP